MNGLVLRPMTTADVAGVVCVENASFHTPWSMASFYGELENACACYLVALEGETVRGYVGLWIVLDEAQITNVAVAPEVRGRGLGRRLMEAAIACAKAGGARAMTLEVRPSNVAARSLYASFGFVERGRRKDYYADDHEDALLLWLDAL